MLRDGCSSGDLLLPLGYADWHRGQNGAYPHSTGETSWKASRSLVTSSKPQTILTANHVSMTQLSR